MPKYKVIAPLLHEGVIVASGFIDLDDDQAKRLADFGVIGPAPQELVDDQADEPLDKKTIPELRSYAAENGIDLGELTKKGDILDAILKAGEANGKPDEQAGA
ncbi:MAG: Rho termination factor N-terminal domain-containing protein [Aerococcus urinaeequi]